MQAALDNTFQGAVEAGKLPGVGAVSLDRSGNVIYNSAFGRTRSDDADSPSVTTRTPLNIYSCTKLFTSVAALQLVEQGKLDINSAASKYLPQLRDIKVLYGFGEDGVPILEPAKQDILVLHLFTHTSGFAYEFFSMDVLRYRLGSQQPPAAYYLSDSREYYLAALMHEPGSAYAYGISTDWLGFIVETISGIPLHEYVDKNIIQPLGLKDTKATLSPAERDNLFELHWKDPSGTIKCGPGVNPDPTVPLKMPGGGEYLYSTCEDLAQFFLTFLNGGTHPVSKATLLKPETVRDYLFTDLLPQVGCSSDGVGVITSAIPPVTNTGTFLPGVSKGWSAGLLINNEDVPNGRSKGSGFWAGLGNLFYWIDPSAGKLGVVASAEFPFMDAEVLHLFDALERAVYGKPAAQVVGEAGSNFASGDSS